MPNYSQSIALAKLTVGIALFLLLSPSVTLAQHSEHDHDSHSPQINTEDYQAKLKLPSQITPNKSIPLTINIRSKNNKPVKKFDTFQTKLMHLIIVSDNLQFFNHIHPEYNKSKGSFTINTIFPYAGNYTLFSDYKPQGKSEQISVLKAKVSGTIQPSIGEIDFNTSKEFEQTKVNLKLANDQIKSGEKTTLIFELKDQNNQPIKDLKPYLGERGHLVIIRDSKNLTKSDYIHVHPIKNKSNNELQFMTTFPQSGKYKIWGQFSRNGKVITADFWLNVK